MFDVSQSIRDSNPLQPDLTKTDSMESSSTQISSILSHPKQKLTAQFKRAITMIKQRSEPAHDSSSPPKLLPTMSLIEKPDATLLTSLIEEPIHNELPSQSYVHIKPSNQENDLNSATIINLDPVTRLNQQNQNQSIRIIKPDSQQDQIPQSSSSSATLSPTPPSSSSTATTGELTILVTNL